MATALDLSELAARVTRPDEQARRECRERLATMPGGPGALGRLEDLAVWLAGVQGRCPTRPVERPRLLVFAGDHGIAAADGSGPTDAAGAAETLRSLADGASILNVVAASVYVPVRAVDVCVDADPAELPARVGGHRVRRGSGRIDLEDAMDRADAEEALAMGAALADQEVDSGADLLVCGHVGAGASTVADVLVGALTRGDAASVCGRHGGIDDAVWIRRCAAIRDALRRARGVLGDQVQLLATAGGADFAAMTGFLLQAAVRRTPVLLDGSMTAAAALVAHRIAFRAADWWLAGDLSPEPSHAMALDRLSLEPVLHSGLSCHDGSGALLGVPTLRAAAMVVAD